MHEFVVIIITSTSMSLPPRRRCCSFCCHHSLQMSPLSPRAGAVSGRGTGGERPAACRPSWSPARCLLLLLCVDVLHVLLNVLHRQHLERLAWCRDGNLNVLRSRLHHLQQRLDGELDRLFPVHALLVVALEKLAHCLA